MAIFTIIRGLQGSGKSTQAKVLQNKYGTAIIEPDQFLIRNKVYDYTEERYKVAVKSASVALQRYLWNESDVIYADILPKIDDVLKLIKYNCIPVINFHLYHKYKIRIIDMTIIKSETQKPLLLSEAERFNRHNVKHDDLVLCLENWQNWNMKKSFLLSALVDGKICKGFKP